MYGNFPFFGVVPSFSAAGSSIGWDLGGDRTVNASGEEFMGSVTLPTRGRVGIDSSVIIYSVEQHPSFAPLLLPSWDAVESGAVTIVVSELALMEVLILPLRLSDGELARQYQLWFDMPGVQRVPIHKQVLCDAASLRARYRSLRSPDAIHLATARLEACDQFLTNDRALLNVVDGLQVDLVSELVTTTS